MILSNYGRQWLDDVAGRIVAEAILLHKESYIRDMDGVPWQFCRQLRQKVKEVCPTGRARITNGIKCE